MATTLLPREALLGRLGGEEFACLLPDVSPAEALARAEELRQTFARVLHYQIGSALLEGRLQVVLADYEEEPLPIHVVYPEGRQAPAKVRTFVDLAVARLRAVTDPLVAPTPAKAPTWRSPTSRSSRRMPRTRGPGWRRPAAATPSAR